MKLIAEMKAANAGEDDEEEAMAVSDKGIKKPDADDGGGCFACCGPRKDNESDSDEPKDDDEGEEEAIPELKVKEKKSTRPFMIKEADSKTIIEIKEKLRKENGGD
jgi:hypothetical protein